LVLILFVAPKTEQKKRGRPKLYFGQVDVKNIDKDQFAEECRRKTKYNLSDVLDK